MIKLDDVLYTLLAEQPVKILLDNDTIELASSDDRYPFDLYDAEVCAIVPAGNAIELHTCAYFSDKEDRYILY